MSGLEVEACSRCDKPALVYQIYSGIHLCAVHLRASIRKRVSKALREQVKLPKDPLEKSDRSYPIMKQTGEALVHLADKPMLICWGLKDFVFGRQFLDEWVRRFPTADVHRFEDSGHYVLEDAGEEIIPLVRRFIARQMDHSA